MPFLNEQTLIVNQELCKGALKEARFQSGRYEGIANEVVREGKNFPAIMSKDAGKEGYEALDLAVVDDTVPIQIYHKILAKRYELNVAGTKSEFGDRNKYVRETVLVKMVVYGKYSALKVTKEQLEAIITTNFPDNMVRGDNELLDSLNLDSISYAMQSSNFLSKSVWDEEYRGNDFALAPEDIFFSINYTITSTFRKGCFQLCNCN